MTNVPSTISYVDAHLALPFAHGGPQGPDEALLDFSVNTNPLGPNPELARIWQTAPVDRYPDPHYTRAREALAGLHNWDPDGVVLGVGASELLHRIARAFVRPGQTVYALGAPFGEFAHGVALQGGTLRVLPRHTALNMHSAEAHEGTLLYLSNPHNPTGHWLEPAELAAWPGLLVVDEAYLPFLESPTELAMRDRLIRVCSPGKAHGVLGMRIAYALTTPLLARQLRMLQPAWAIPGPLAAVLAALPAHQEFVARTLPIVRAWAHALAEALGATWSGLHFFTVSVDDAARVAQGLRAQGIRVRDCTSFGYPNLIRIATRRPEENARLIAAWHSI
jgi:histidinol-phosphate aminotransferase